MGLITEINKVPLNNEKKKRKISTDMTDFETVH